MSFASLHVRCFWFRERNELRVEWTSKGACAQRVFPLLIHQKLIISWQEQQQNHALSSVKIASRENTRLHSPLTQTARNSSKASLNIVEGPVGANEVSPRLDPQFLSVTRVNRPVIGQLGSPQIYSLSCSPENSLSRNYQRYHASLAHRCQR